MAAILHHTSGIVYPRDWTGTLSGSGASLSLADGSFSDILITALADAGVPTITPRGTTGATTYGYKVVARDTLRTAAASTEGTTATGNATLSATNYNEITWTAVTNAVSYDIYRTTGGATQGKIGNTTGLTINDTGLVGGGETAPATNTTGSLAVGGTTGVLISSDGDGAITFKSLSGGSAEDLTINLDDTANTAVVSSSTGVTAIQFTALEPRLVPPSGDPTSLSLWDNGGNANARGWGWRANGSAWGVFNLRRSATQGADPQAGSNVFTFDINSNMGLVTATPGGGSTVGTGVLSLANGTPPAGGVANQVSLFSEDVAASAELKALDEAGNTPTLSPHNFTLFTPPAPDLTKPASLYPWSYVSRNAYLGYEIGVDMAGLVIAVEALTGRQFAYIRSIPTIDWDEGQDRQVSQAYQRRQDWAARRDAFTPTPGNPTFLEPEPTEYRPKAPPTWMRNRLAAQGRPVRVRPQ